MSQDNQAAQQSQTGSSEQLPGLVRSFVTYFTRYVDDGNVAEIHSIYENSFNKLTERFYKSSPWPQVSQVQGFLGRQKLATLLYKELYFRHIYSRLTPSLADRIESWSNYLELFNWLMRENGKKIRLPISWLFDLIDEFVWQAQSFNHYRSKMKSLSSADRTTLQQHTDLWSLSTVLKTLEHIVAETGVNSTLQSQPDSDPKRFLDSANGGGGLALGYFALVGLMRMHCMMGDYSTALKSVQHVRMMKGNDEDMFCSQVAACHVTLYYYYGFCQMMLWKFDVALDAFQSILMYASRAIKPLSRPHQQDLINKKQDQMVALLALCWTILGCPVALDTGVAETVEEKHHDVVHRARRGDVSSFEELFVQSCPKFLVAQVPPLTPDVPSGGNNSHLEPLKQQQQNFMQQVRARASVPRIRSYLRLYPVLTVDKLAQLLQVKPEECRALLQSYKQNTHPSDPLTFQMQGDNITVSEVKQQTNVLQPLLDGIKRVEQLYGR